MDSPTGLFLTGTGTGVGKTHVGRALARLARIRGRPLAAIKPIETGCDPEPVDAAALERASGTSGTAQAAGLYRARLPAAPLAATLAGAPEPPSIADLAETTRRLASLAGGRVLVEGAGGPFVPLTPHRDLLHLAAELGLPVLLVAPNGLGVLSHTVATRLAMTVRGVPPAAVVLVDVAPVDGADPSRRTNAAILEHAVAPTPLHRLPFVPDDIPTDDHDGRLAAAADEAGLARWLP